MRLQVRLFGGLAERVGHPTVVVAVDEEADVEALLLALADQHPAIAPLLPRCSIAVDLEVVDRSHRLTGGEEVAVLPPVAGGGARILVGVREDRLDIDEALAAVASPAAGGTVIFLGTVRDHSAQMEVVERLEYRAYTAMAERVLGEIAAEVATAWPQITGVCLLHAVGDLPVGAPTIAVACSAPHRQQAYAASARALEEVKERVPVWKREVGPGGARWVGLGDHAH